VKAKLLTLALLAWALEAPAQGTFQFQATLTGANEVPPNNDPTVGTGVFTLSGNLLTFRVDVPLITFITTGGTINGPAGPGTNAPVVFDLGFFSAHPGNSQGSPPGYTFMSTNYTLNTDQINQLLTGLWYVNITSSTEPAGQLRGQILEVPEPSAVALLSLSIGIIILSRRQKEWSVKPLRVS